MTNWNLYTAKLTINGANTRERQINNIKSGIISSFDDSPSFAEVYINGAVDSTRVNIVDENSLNRNPNRKRILMKPEDIIAVGDTVLWNSKLWLVTDLDPDNGIYYVGIIDKCNNTFHIKTGTTQIIKGYDSMGRPIIEEQPTYTDFPCIETSSLSVNRRSDLNEPINIPFGRTIITIPYTDKVNIGLNFEINGQEYIIIDISYSRSGLVDFMADKVV